MRILSESSEDMFFSGYGLTLHPGRNDIPEPEPRLKRLLKLYPQLRVLRDDEAWPDADAAKVKAKVAATEPAEAPVFATAPEPEIEAEGSVPPSAPPVSVSHNVRRRKRR